MEKLFETPPPRCEPEDTSLTGNAIPRSLILIVDLGQDGPQACQPSMLAAVRSKGIFRGPTILSNLSAICVNDKITGLGLRKAKKKGVPYRWDCHGHELGILCLIRAM